MSRDQNVIFLVEVEGGFEHITAGASVTEFGAVSLAKQLLRYEQWRTSTVWKIRDAAMYGPGERAHWECVAHFERDEHNRIIQIVGDVPDFIKEGAST